MAAYSSLPNQPIASGWFPDVEQSRHIHRYEAGTQRRSDIPQNTRVSTPSSTAYEPYHLKPGVIEHGPSKDSSSVRTSAASWVLEIIAIIISVAAIVSIIALLHRENGRPLSAWKLAITLNTIVAALGTLARTTLAFALSACVGQQKWNWLKRKPDVLVAWERFDEASRGPWGGARLLVWLRARHWATLGALVTVGAIAFDPFLQAVIGTYGQLDSISSTVDATIGQSLRIDSGIIHQVVGASVRDVATGLSYSTGISGRADFGFISSVWSGFQNTSTFRNDAIGVECSTGNCTWPVFTSAAVCSSCEDVSSHMVRRQFHGRNGTNVPSFTNFYEGEYVKFELPYANIRNYIGLLDEDQKYIPVYMTANTTVNATRTVMFKDMETLLMAFTVMKAPEAWLDHRMKWEDATPIAQECALYLCANAYESRSENSVVTERILGSWVRKSAGSYVAKPDPMQSDPNAPEAWVKSLGNTLYDAKVNRTDLQLLIPLEESEHLPEHVRREFNVSHAFIYSAMHFLLDYTKQGVQIWNNPGSRPMDPPDETWTMMGAPWWNTGQPAVLDALWNSTNLTMTFENVARSLTNQIRNSSPDRHHGELEQWAIHVRVDWAYLAYPLSMLVAGILYVVLTVVESRRLRMPVWKESALPTLLHGFDDETQRLLRTDGKAGQRKVLVRFEEDEEGCQRLVAQQ